MRLIFDFGPAPRRVVLSEPVEEVRADAVEEVVPALRRIEAAVARGCTAAGYIAYEAAPAFEPRMRVRPGARMPLLWFGVFAGENVTQRDAARASAIPGGEPEVPGPWRFDTSRAEYEAAVADILEEIAAGRTYQTNLTTRLQAPFAGDPLVLYQGMRAAQGPGYHALLDLGPWAVVSASPELFFRTTGRDIETRPMKGTRPRGRWPDEDAAMREALASSPKDLAENLMVVDLLRNDLGRICETGSVRVPRRHAIERYRTVWQMTSTVTGRLRAGIELVDVLGALFPCGSVTGAPKIRTMEVIAALERSPREVYCGAIGLIRPGGDATFNVPIRTAWIDRRAGEVAYGAGGGVVADSDPAAEYDEMLAKAIVIRDPWPSFRLLETLRLDGGRFLRLERHLHRMRASALHFDRSFPADAIADALDALRRSHFAGSHRVRLLLDDQGRVETEAFPLPESSGVTNGAEPPRMVAIAACPVDSRDRFLYHKTTRRQVFDRARAAAPGAWDVLLLNERGELTELTRGNLVVELDGALLTPPAGAGLLPGCLRAELLEAGTLTEATLRPGDLRRASRAWSINSLRGWIPVRIADSPGDQSPGEPRRSSYSLWRAM